MSSVAFTAVAFVFVFGSSLCATFLFGTLLSKLLMGFVISSVYNYFWFSRSRRAYTFAIACTFGFSGEAFHLALIVAIMLFGSSLQSGFCFFRSALLSASLMSRRALALAVTI